MTTPRFRRALLAATVPVLALGLLSGCTATTAAETSPAPSDAGFPVTIENCGSTITLDAPARRIVLVNDDELPNLEALRAVDRIVAITATPQPGLYADATYDALDALSPLTAEQNATGGSVVSQESILGASPDLVIAPENAVDRNALAASGIPVYSPTAYCSNPDPELSTTATFDRVWNEVRSLGSLLGAGDQAEQAIAAAKATVQSSAPAAGTAAALYVSSGGAVLSPYGGPSMVTPVFAAAGLTNVYADSDQRVFDASVEDIISRDPGTIVLLYSSGDPQGTIDTFLNTPGVSGLRAVREDRVVALRFPYTDPPSVLSVRGPGELARLLDGLG